MADKRKKVMLINVTHAEESRIAILQDGVLEAFEIETFDYKSEKGNIYKGRVESVHPGLQAAFVDIGGTRGSFLPIDEVNFNLHPARTNEGKGRIENHIKRKDELLVQVVRDAYGTKPSTLSTYFSLPGRYLVLTPFQPSAGISRKLDDKQRERLRKVLDDLPIDENFGVIARTAGASATKADLQRDFKYLERLWQKVDVAARSVRAPKLIYQERNLVIRTIRDLFTHDIDEILVDDEGTWREILDFFEVVLPHKKKIVKLFEADRPIFNKYNLEDQIENIFRRKVALPSGGAVVFDTTEALTAVDVNSGKMVREGHIEDTALKANIEAAEEICRQLRLRDLGGLVVIDFIDMRSAKNVRQVEKATRDALKKDRARYDATRISRLGLMEISRERLRPQKSSLRYTDCTHCGGSGSVKTIEAAAIQAFRALQTSVVRGNVETVEMSLPVEVAEYLLNNKREEIVAWERRYQTRIMIHAVASMNRDATDLSAVTREKVIQKSPVVSPPTHLDILSDMEDSPEQESAGSEENGDATDRPKKKRRRRRRGGRGRGNGKAAAEANQDDQTDQVEQVDDAEEACRAEASDVGEEAGDAAVEQAASVRPKRRRRRRGGRGRGRGRDRTNGDAADGEAAASTEEVAADGEQSSEAKEEHVLAVSAAPVDADSKPGPRSSWWSKLLAGGL